MKTITVPALTEQLDTVLEFVQGELDQINCSPKICNQIAIAVEEIFVNIAHYAYRPDVGDATIRCQVSTQGQPQITIEFLDSGKPYDPLKNDEPDTTLPAEERRIGGLGIFMVKRLMDTVQYEYRDGKNILTLQKLV
ncbi:ATP-binding protein [Agathobaculum sp. TL06]